MQETWVWSLGWEDALEKEMATHSSILAWEILWTVEPDELQPTGSQRVGHDWVTKPPPPLMSGSKTTDIYFLGAWKSKIKMWAGLVSSEASLLGLQTAAFPTDCLPSLHVGVLIFSYCVYAKLLSRVWLFATPWTVVRQPSLSMGFSRQEYWNGLPCPPPNDLLDPGIKLTSLISPALAGGFFTTSAIWTSYYMDTSQIGLWSTCMTLFNFNYLFEDTLLRQSHSEVLGVRTST